MSLGKNLTDWNALHKASINEEKKPTLHYKVYDQDRLLLSLIGDEHIGSKHFNEDLLKRRIDWCLEHQSPVILMGDEIEASTRDSVGAGVYEQQEIIDAQVQHFIHLYKPLADAGLLLGKHGGNHEYRIYQTSGFDLNKAMCRELGIRTFSWGQLHYFRVGKESYVLYSTHGSSQAIKAHTKIRSALLLSDIVDADIYAQGHVHQLSHHIRNFYQADKRARKVIEAQKHFILTGAYLDHWGSYGHMKSYEPMRKGSPLVKLHGDKREIRVSL